MQRGMPQEISMTEQSLQRHEELVHAGTKRRSPPTVQSDSEDLMFPPSPSSEKIVQTTKSKGIVNVQLFIRKAFAMINECDPSIASWTEDGDKFVVKNKDIFAATVIPQYYDHNNYSSFTRQLNFYGFTREQSMTIKVSDLNSLAVGQETFYHQHFQRGRPDLLKNLQRRSTDNKNSKKRKKPRTEGDVSFLHGRIEAMEETTKEMMATMKQMRDESFAAAAAIQNLQNLNAAKDEKISALEKRIDWLERRLSSSAFQRQESIINTTQRLNLPGPGTDAATFMAAQGLMAPAAATSGTFGGIQGQQNNNASLLPTSEVGFSANVGNNNGFAGSAMDAVGALGGGGGAPTLARHPKMKKFLGNPPRDIFSYENATTNISNNMNAAVQMQGGLAPSRETSLDLGLLNGLARESTLLSWLPRQDTEPKTLP